MLTFATPLWLAGLALVPVIRWLHRGGAHRREVAVSRLALWRDAEASRPGAGERRPPDPAWRRRALLAALLFVALAGPQLAEERVRVTLWVDDSLSMLTREADTTRLRVGLARARSLLAESPQAEVEVRTLADPWRNLGALDDATIATVLAGAGRREPIAPPAALLRRDSRHWLLTDGADAALLAWPGDKRPDRFVQVASVTRNVGLERLAARRRAEDPATLAVLVQVTNGGSVDEDRVVVFTVGAVEIARTDIVHLRPGTSQRIGVSIPESATLVAALQPADALPDDDRITMDLAPLRRRRVDVDATCPKALVAAVRAHPALTPASTPAEAEARIDCGASSAPVDVPTIRVVADAAPSRPHGALRWSATVPPSQRAEFDADRLQLAAHLRAGAGDSVLLAIGDEPVIVRRMGQSRRLETSFDFVAMAAARGPEVPLLVNSMLQTALGQSLLDQVVVVDRGPRAVLVAPREIVAAPAASTAAVPRSQSERATAVLLLVALLVLLWEVVALVRQGLRLRVPAPARTG